MSISQNLNLLSYSSPSNELVDHPQTGKDSLRFLQNLRVMNIHMIKLRIYTATNQKQKRRKVLKTFFNSAGDEIPPDW